MPQWTLFENDFRAIDQVLNELLERTNALSVHLVDRSGQLITTAGRAGDFDATAFASLIAADFTANAEVSQLLGERGVEAVVSEGKSRSVYSCMLADRVIMATVFDRRSTLGLVRFRANRAVQELDRVFRGLFEKVGITEPEVEAPEFAAAAGHEVDALFGD
jgi:predicted regulator of Ras-like GTPase activity (Roadblock/LC7/MglB family)